MEVRQIRHRHTRRLLLVAEVCVCSGGLEPLELSPAYLHRICGLGAGAPPLRVQDLCDGAQVRHHALPGVDGCAAAVGALHRIDFAVLVRSQFY